MRTFNLARAVSRRFRVAAILLIFSSLISADEETGQSNATFVEPPAWTEEVPEPPAYPDNDRLLELPASQPGDDFRVFIDPDSLSVGKDGVVRYTLAIVSSSGVRNITYEGLNCGQREYRRYAYGSGNAWHPLEASSWQRVSDSGMDHYRYVLYWDYLCNPVQTNLDVAAMLNGIRKPSGTVFHE